VFIFENKGDKIMSDYFINKNGKQLGPYSFEQIQEMKMGGVIDSNVLYWKEGMENWQNVESLLGATQVIAPPLPATLKSPLEKHSVTEKDFVHGGFWLRFAAALLDGIFTYIIGFVIGFVVAVVMILAGASEDETMAVSYVVGFVIGWLYYVLFESSAKQATWGKMICGLKVVDMHGGRLSFGKANGRYFAKFISLLTLCIGYLLCVFTKNKQCLHDIISGCLVIKK
jgi:uncharacterized RDD family membrane protein YckC